MLLIFPESSLLSHHFCSLSLDHFFSFVGNNFQVDRHTHAVRSCFCAIHLPNRYTRKKYIHLRAQALRFLYTYISLRFLASSFRSILLWMMEWEIQLLAHRMRWFENIELQIDTVNQPLNHCNVLTTYYMYQLPVPILQACVVRMKTNPIEHEQRHHHHHQC